MKNCAEKITKVKMRFPIRFDNVSDSFDVVLQYLLLCKIQFSKLLIYGSSFMTIWLGLRLIYFVNQLHVF
jgi:hypothetical protein